VQNAIAINKKSIKFLSLILLFEGRFNRSL
jgi:hypothetical protein